ncbi:MAG: biosynthetic-type acetolactate synthase large subunit [Candidatus Latescibacterota bacterium]|nr:biosynthetic-type acetolactate synthase large subunit [Candidatus Latescibacterota bacterium]
MAAQAKQTEENGRSDSTQPQMNGADILIASIIREGVDVVFGYPGGASMEIHQAITRSNLRNILCRHEQGEIFAAEGYAKASGKVGVCVATSGPGATNLVTGLADAKMDSVALVTITGQVPAANIGRDSFQETPIIEITRQITKHNYLIERIEDIPRIIKEAFYLASSGRPGPVLVDIPKNIQQAIAVPVYPDTVEITSYNPVIRATRDEIQKMSEMIRTSDRPIVYSGGGIVTGDASSQLREFVAKTQIPVAQTLMGLGAFPETDPLSLQMLGMHGSVYANYAVNHADLLLAFGVRFDDRVTGKLEEFAKHGKIVHVDIDPSELNKNKEAHLPVESDIKYALEELNAVVEGGDYSAWRKDLETWRKKHPFSYQDLDDAILPQYAIDLLYKKTEGKAIIATGVGQHQMWAAQFYPFDEPRNWLTSGGLGSMGFGLPSAIGAALARPDELVVDIDGDGSFVMNIQELATLYAEKIPVKMLILNNQHLGMVVQWEDRFYKGNRGHTYIGDPEAVNAPDDMKSPPGHLMFPDFVTIAKGFKIPAERVEHKADLDAALQRMIDEPGSFLLDVVTPYQEHVLPMIPGGMTFADIITE